MDSISDLTAYLNVTVQVDSTQALSLGTIRDRILSGANLPSLGPTLTYGTGPYQLNTFYCERLTLAPGNSDLDLFAIPTSRPPEGSRDFGLVRWLLLRIAAPASGDLLELGDYGALGWQGPIYPGTALPCPDYLILSNLVDGWTVDASHRHLRLHNPGAASLEADLIILGVTRVVTVPTLAVVPGTRSNALTWDEIDGATYKLYRGLASGTETLFQSDINVPSYTDSGLSDGTRYFYVVTAVVAGVESARSNEVSGLTAPAAPTGLAAYGGTGGRLCAMERLGRRRYLRFARQRRQCQLVDCGQRPGRHHEGR